MKHARSLVAAFVLGWVALSPVSGLAQQSRSARPELPRRIAVAWFARSGLAEAAVGRMQDEVAALFAPLGISVSWHPRARRADLPAGALRLRVTVVSSNPASWGLPVDTLGAVLGSADPRRSVYVFDPNVSRLVERARRAHGRQPPPASLLGRAMGRVVAHEIVHAIAPRHPHQDAGLMSSGWRATVLAGLRLDLDEASRSALLDGLDAALAAVQPPQRRP